MLSRNVVEGCADATKGAMASTPNAVINMTSNFMLFSSYAHCVTLARSTDTFCLYKFDIAVISDFAIPSPSLRIGSLAGIARRSGHQRERDDQEPFHFLSPFGAEFTVELLSLSTEHLLVGADCVRCADQPINRLAPVWGLVTLRHTFVECRHGFRGAREISGQRDARARVASACHRSANRRG